MSGDGTARTWVMTLSLGLPLSVVGASGMAISYATLIDVARVNGMPLPELFPVLVDVGTVACLVAGAHLRRLGISGRWLAHITFVALSAISVFANATHAVGAADMALTNASVAVLLAATPPAALLAITHLVMQLLPDGRPARRRAGIPQASVVEASSAESAPQADVLAWSQSAEQEVERNEATDATRDVDERIREALTGGRTPTGREIGDWLGGKSARTGQRYLGRFLAQGEGRSP